MSLQRLLAITLTTLFSAVPGSAQGRLGHPGGDVSASGVPHVSSRVVASWHYERSTSAASQRFFLVLYRGEPVWYLRNAESDMLGARGSTRIGPGGNVETGSLELHHVAGGVDLTIRVDGARSILRVLGKELSLTEHNVFLVDRVDGVGGPPEIVRRLRVELDPASDFAGPDFPDVVRIIGRLPTLQVFVGSM